ncbi:MAG: hypothetical protein C0410_07850 [Anaerolinea sp.]|nr:hypothetical protein [Anaerolinea sp.]
MYVLPVKPDSGEKFHSPLQGLPNAILTPHEAGSTQKAQSEISEFVSGKMLNFLSRDDTKLRINFPQIELHSLQRNAGCTVGCARTG